MPWSDVIGQHRAKETLKRSIAADRVAHAYLFFGPDGVGKRATAVEFARALQCERRGDEACGTCLPCTKIARLVHPDVTLHFPYPKDTPTEELSERIRLAAENPYAEVDFIRRPSLTGGGRKSNRMTIYTVERINEDLRRAMGYSPVEGRYKIAILTDAESMRQEAANAFLKMLEEPGPRTVFVLLTSRPDNILPTIYSRCQRLRFDMLGVTEIENALRERAGVDAERAATLARMADGSYARALEHMGNDELLEMRMLVIDFFRQAYVLKALNLSAIIDKVNAYRREQIKGILRLMLAFVRDLMLIREMGAEAPIVNIDQKEVLTKFVEGVPVADLEGMAERIEQAIAMVGRNVHIGLVFTVLAHVLHRGMREGEVPQLAPDLAEP